MWNRGIQNVLGRGGAANYVRQGNRSIWESLTESYAISQWPWISSIVASIYLAIPLYQTLYEGLQSIQWILLREDCIKIG